MFPLTAVALFVVVSGAAIGGGWAEPQPSIIRERHVIHTPIKFRVIHHYKIKKIPVVIKKHLHFHQYPVNAKPAVEEIHVNHIQQDDSEVYGQHFEVPQQYYGEHSHDTEPPLREGDAHKYSPLYFKPPQKDDDKGHSSHELRSEYEIPPGVLPQEDEHESQEEDYKDAQQSQEDYEDYDYE